MRRKNSVWANIDWFTIGIYFLLVVLGWFNIYSAVYVEDSHETFDFASRYGRQLIWIGASIGIIFTATIIDSKFYSTFAMFIYAAVILLLMAVLVVGVRINGAQSWFVIGPIRLQPAEFAKFATSLALAKMLSAYNMKPKKLKTLLRFCLIAFLPLVLILMQNDTGSALVFFIFFLVYFREGLPSAYLMVGFLSMALFVLSLLYDNFFIVFLLEIIAFCAFYIIRRNLKDTLIGFSVLSGVNLVFWFVSSWLFPEWSKTYSVIGALAITTIWFLSKIYKHKINEGVLLVVLLFSSIAFTYSVDYVFDNVLGGYQQRRVKVLLGIESDPFGAGYNVNQSMIAIGSGGPSGKGYLQGTQTKFKFVPEQSTDFIFCTVGEEWGFMGTTLVLALFLVLILRVIFLAERQKSSFSRIYGYCVASIFFFHIAINVGMTIGLAPVIGIPLPFFSYGGSSLWAFTFLLFIFLKLDANRDELIN